MQRSTRGRNKTVVSPIVNEVSFEAFSDLLAKKALYLYTPFAGNSSKFGAIISSRMTVKILMTHSPCNQVVNEAEDSHWQIRFTLLRSASIWDYLYNLSRPEYNPEIDKGLELVSIALVGSRNKCLVYQQ